MTGHNWHNAIPIEPDHDPDRIWREAEKRAVCTCGLIQVGYRGSWAISHAKLCPVAEVYRTLMARTEPVR